MATSPDRYDVWYSKKLWNLLPEVYRALDAPEFDQKGPLQELVERIGAQAAIVRRSIDRLWEDQSIETCDDWLINYLGDLLGTNLVTSLDPRGRRVDVAKTIYYRRRKGTAGLLEELATDITGWGVRVEEFFHRLARTRHGLDPALGLPEPPTHPRGSLQRAQRLFGVRTQTGAGGFADLRSIHGANLTNTAFDEYFHTADVRRGRRVNGWHNISHVGAFLWRLKSFPARQVTPVQARTCPNQYTFDPTGRDIPLFAAGDRPHGDRWVSPSEHQMPGPISADLLRAAFLDLYCEQAPRSLAVYRLTGTAYDFVPPSLVSEDPFKPKPGSLWIDPKRGRIIAPTNITDGVYRVDYHYGFASEIGAGAFERRAQRLPAAPPGESIVEVSGGVDGLTSGLAKLPSDGTRRTGTVVIDDSLTYTAITDVSVGTIELRAKTMLRPVIRPSRPLTAPAIDWVFTGVGEAVLVLDGLFVSGANIVLAGYFARVTVSCCTLDPGSWTSATAPEADHWTLAADGQELAASRLQIQGTVRHLRIERSITGPIVDSGTGVVESMTVSESIVQAVGQAGNALSLTSGEVSLSRCTVLGAAQLHRLEASECILRGAVEVADTQHGCVRFSGWSGDSVLPRKYESVFIAPGASVFASQDFGRPEFAQLHNSADSAITEGAEDGSEMGAFAREKSAIKARSLLIKYQEYLPLGLEPVLIQVT